MKEASPDAISRCLTRGYGQRNDTETESFVVAFHPTQDPIHSADGTTHALGCGFSGGQDPVVPWPAEIAPTLNAQFGSKQGLEDQHIHGGAGLFVPVASATPCAVRRLTPTECERLQGFPDGWTDITPGKTADGPRYKALGNSMAVPVMAWIGRRIAEVSK